jgi:large subunit ribosomal protein L21e
VVKLMVRRSKGYRSGTRALLRKEPRKKGKISISKLLRTYAHGDKVCIKIDSSVHKGMPHSRFYGKTGVIAGKRGRSYVVTVPVGRRSSTILVRPEHLESRGS